MNKPDKLTSETNEEYTHFTGLWALIKQEVGIDDTIDIDHEVIESKELPPHE